MDPELTREEIIEMLPAYVLGALEPDEMLAVEAYLEQHHDLLPRLHSAEEAAAQLAYLAPATPLPDDARDRLMSRVKAE
jgi:anti-sigma factor RsiW